MDRPSRGKRASLVLAFVVLAGLLAAVGSLRRELRAWYLLRAHFERLPKNKQGYPEYRHHATGIVFVWLPGGTFVMGSDEEETRRASEESTLWKERFAEEQPHAVNLSAFLIAKYEVNQAQWASVMGTNPAHFKGQDHPAENLTWDVCREFCTRKGLSLPTEAQWEYAARAGTSGPYGGTGIMEEMGWSADSAHEHQPVGRKKPNGFGLHDMHGNVAEWVEDVHDKAFYSRPEAAGPDPVCTTVPSHVAEDWGSWDPADAPRVARGGGTHNPLFCRSAVRVAYFPNQGGADVGFRPVFNPR